MPIHGEHGNETDVRAERSEIYQRDGDLGDELSWMAPIYEKFDEQRAILMEQKEAMAKEAGRAEIHRSLVEDKLSDACARIDKLECSTVDLENRLSVLERRSRTWESLEERYQTVLAELVTKMCGEIQDNLQQDLESLKREIAQQRNDLHTLKSVYVEADVTESKVQVKHSEHVSPGGVSSETNVTSRRRLPSLPRIHSTIVGERTIAETSQPVQRPGTYSGNSLWESYHAQF